jgi:hypothetical protein
VASIASNEKDQGLKVAEAWATGEGGARGGVAVVDFATRGSTCRSRLPYSLHHHPEKHRLPIASHPSSHLRPSTGSPPSDTHRYPLLPCSLPPRFCFSLQLLPTMGESRYVDLALGSHFSTCALPVFRWSPGTRLKDMTDSSLRQELLAWLNDLLELNLTKVEQCGTGYVESLPRSRASPRNTLGWKKILMDEKRCLLPDL